MAWRGADNGAEVMASNMMMPRRWRGTDNGAEAMAMASKMMMPRRWRGMASNSSIDYKSKVK